MIKKVLVLGGIGALAVPALALVTALAVATSSSACLSTSVTYGRLAADAPVPAPARAWVSATVAGCRDLPEAWVAAVMAQESSFNPSAHAEDRNGGTWGLLQLNANVWQAAYGHPWSADLDHDGVWDVRDPAIHARVGGTYLCQRLGTVRTLLTKNPSWPAAQLPMLDALLIAHNAGESRLRSYPDIPTSTAQYLENVDAHAAAWSSVEPLDRPDSPRRSGEPTSAPVPALPDPLRQAGTGCVPGLGTGNGVTVPPGTPNDVAAAVRTAMSYVGVQSGWDGLCDRLACRAYGYANAGYYSAAVHWSAMLAQGHAHPGDACPPLGSFVFFRSAIHPFGHVSLVIQASPSCDPNEILVTSNGVFDHATGNHGGVYLLSFARLSAMYIAGHGYLGWSDPVCAGSLLPPSTARPEPSG